MNQVKFRLQALGLLDRAFSNTPDPELQQTVDALEDDHRAALDELVGGEVDAEALRDAIGRGRLDGTLESAALVVSDACLADCIEGLGDHADHPSTDQLREVLPGLVEHHGLGITQIMMASTIAGDAPAASILRDLLKHDDLVKLPPVEPKPATPLAPTSASDDAERAALKAKRKELKKKKQEDARARRDQAARAKGRS